MKTVKLILTVACVALLTQAFLPSYAGDKDKSWPKPEHEQIRAALQRGEVLPLERILAIAKEKVPGDVLETELETKHGALVYEIKVLTDTGRVREIKIDAREGTVIKIEDD